MKLCETLLLKFHEISLKLHVLSNCLKFRNSSARRCTDYDVRGTDSLPVSAEGRVEPQKLNQTAALLSFG